MAPKTYNAIVEVCQVGEEGCSVDAEPAGLETTASSRIYHKVKIKKDNKVTNRKKKWRITSFTKNNKNLTWLAPAGEVQRHPSGSFNLD